MKTILTLLLLGFCSYGFGQQLVYRATNPAFGGDPFNYTWLLNSANEQNPFENSGLGGLESLSELDQFTSDLGDPLGEGQPLTPGTNVFGNFELEVLEGINGLLINVLDITTGEQSQIVIPNG